MASISTLPDELVSYILDYLPWAGRDGSWLTAWRLSIMLVCKRWYRLFEPKLFERVRVSHAAAFGSRGIHPDTLVDILHRYPYLANHVRDVTITTSPREKEHKEYDQYDQLFSLIMPVIRLEVSSMTEAFMPLIQRAAQNNHISTINLKQVSFTTILRLFGNSTSLRKLCLRGSRWHEDTFTKRPYASTEDTAAPSSLCDVHPGLVERTGSLRALRLKSIGTTPEHVAIFFTWPAALEDVEFSHFRDRFNWNLEAVQSLLDPHRKSLRRISIGALPIGPSQLQSYRMDRYYTPAMTSPNNPATTPLTFPLNFTQYQSLTSLTLNTHHGFFEYPPTQIGHSLAAPHLTHLTLTFHTENQYGACFEDFSAEAVTFLSVMIPTLLASQPRPTLRTIHIDFDPWQTISGSDPDFLESIQDDPTYPWDHVERAREVARAHGVTLTYRAPTIVKEQWDMEVKGILKRYGMLRQEEWGQVMRW